MLKTIDDFLNKTTMYRLLIYYLGALLVIAFVVGLFGNLGFSSVALFISVGILLAACWVLNRVFAFVFDVSVNHESSIITALILSLLITPKLGVYDLTFLLAASGLAMASKYILTINDVHIFNPAALAVVITAFGPRQNASWWIGTSVLLPFVISGGILVVRKIRRERMVISFFITTFLATALFTWFGHGSVMMAVKQSALTSPVFFLGFVMLTEPLTSPGTKGTRTWFGILVGLLLPPQVHLGSIYTSPELSLVIGNIFAYVIDPRVRLFPVLTQKIRIATNSIDFVFNTDKRLAYQPGQYMEWTLPHSNIDNRGNRRYFTLASSPTEPTLRLGVKFYEPISSYKKAMRDMTAKTQIVAAQVAGDFVLPKDRKRKLVFIAGGIGVTPFRSMVKYLVDKHEQRDVAMLYAANNMKEVSYTEVFEQARQQLGIATTYVLAKPDPNAPLGPHQSTGYIDSNLIRATVLDYSERTFYVSGSHQMVVAVQDALNDLGVPKSQVKVDYFPGYV
jgi:ferredoxin-NADP reductase/Na+-translocating ferredoxin:NAD+ oxidoreductase RnfD subunit